ncbi:hypothetical protein BCR34DRAFT_640443 [Clohesyomyces aquaticus]|uniref:Uncharacterized protein n=1 Tax=Clohesyomyces aquaticus TaxID=1231657 RepID=A0A1Y1YLQ1_9PLEO|nr:hypothetical protein BCR34DRAFT_640443 [Clohesyomyces aquaticus]
MSGAAANPPDHDDRTINTRLKALVAVSGNPALEEIQRGVLNSLSLPDKSEICGHVWKHTSPAGQEKILKALLDQFVKENAKNTADTEHQSELAVRSSSTVPGQALPAIGAIESAGAEVDDQLMNSFANLAIKEWLSHYPDLSNFPSDNFEGHGESAATHPAKRQKLADAMTGESEGSMSMDLGEGSTYNDGMESDSPDAFENDSLTANGMLQDMRRQQGGGWQRNANPWDQQRKGQRAKFQRSQPLEPQVEFILWIPTSPVDGEWRSLSILPVHVVDQLKELVRKKIMRIENGREDWKKYAAMDPPRWANEHRSMMPIGEGRRETFDFLLGSGSNPQRACDTCIAKHRPCTMLVFRNGKVQLGIFPVDAEVGRGVNWWQYLSTWVAPKLPKQLKRKRC